MKCQYIYKLRTDPAEETNFITSFIKGPSIIIHLTIHQIYKLRRSFKKKIALPEDLGDLRLYCPQHLSGVTLDQEEHPCHLCSPDHSLGARQDGGEDVVESGWTVDKTSGPVDGTGENCLLH